MPKNTLFFCAGAQRRRFLFRNGTFKRTSVRSSDVCPEKKTGKLPKPRASGEVTYYFDKNFSRFSRCRKKRKIREKGMIWRDLNIFFKNELIIQIVLDRSEAHSSRPRTYLPSRSGATHALRVLSSLSAVTSKAHFRTATPKG